MKAAVIHGDSTLSLQEIAEPEITAYDALVKIESCLFCNTTDRHLIDGDFPFGMNYPALLGHESIGVVTKIGRKVTKYKIGDRVIRPAALFPGQERDGYHSGWGGFAQYGKVHDADAYQADNNEESPFAGFAAMQQIIPANIDPDECLLLTAQKEIWSSTKSVVEQLDNNDLSQERILISGSGITAYLFGQFLRIMGAQDVTIAARRQSQLDFAKEQQCCNHTLLLQDNLDLSNIEKFSCLIECTGSLDVLGSMAQHLKNEHSPICCYAIYPNNALSESRLDFIRSKHPLTRVDPNEASAHEDVCALIQKQEISCKEFISHEFSINDLNQAWDCVTAKIGIKTCVRMH